MTGPGDATDAVPSPAGELVAALAALLRHRPVLVALDFDGTLAPIVGHPDDARALDGSMELVGLLADSPGVLVALVSGRSRDDLAAISGMVAGPHLLLVGSHGTEVDETGPAGLDAGARRRLEDLTRLLTAVAEHHPGAHVELKPASVVLHTRRIADRQEALAATEQARRTVSGRDDLYVTLGKEVVEVAVVRTGKGAAVDRLRAEHGLRGVLYVGDDVTDEDAFTVLLPGDVGVKVGAGPTAATHRVADPAAVRELLRTLLTLATAA